MRRESAHGPEQDRAYQHDTSTKSGSASARAAQAPVTPDEAYKLFLAALNSVGLTVEGSGSVMRVVPMSR